MLTGKSFSVAQGISAGFLQCDVETSLPKSVVMLCTLFATVLLFLQHLRQDLRMSALCCFARQVVMAGVS